MLGTQLSPNYFAMIRIYGDERLLETWRLQPHPDHPTKLFRDGEVSITVEEALEDGYTQEWLDNLPVYQDSEVPQNFFTEAF